MPAISSNQPPPVHSKFEGVKNFAKNVWQPWNAEKGHRAGPIVGFVALSVLTLGLFAIPGIVSLVKRINQIGKSSPGVQKSADTTSKVFDSTTRVAMLQTTLRTIEDELRKSKNIEPERLKSLLNSQQKLEKQLADLGFQTKSMSPHESDLLERVYKDGNLTPEFLEKAKSYVMDTYVESKMTKKPSEFEAELISIIQDGKNLEGLNPFKDGKLKPGSKEMFERFQKAAEKGPKDPFTELNPFEDGKLKPGSKEMFERFQKTSEKGSKDPFSSLNPFEGGKLKSGFEETFKGFKSRVQQETKTDLDSSIETSPDVEEIDVDVEDLKARLAVLRNSDEVEFGSFQGPTKASGNVLEDLRAKIADLEEHQKFDDEYDDVKGRLAEGEAIFRGIQRDYDNGLTSEEDFEFYKDSYENFKSIMEERKAQKSANREFIEAEKNRLVGLEGKRKEISTLEEVISALDSRIAKLPTEDALEGLQEGSPQYEETVSRIQERAELEQEKYNLANDLDRIINTRRTTSTPNAGESVKEISRRDWLQRLGGAASGSKTSALYEELEDLDGKMLRLESSWSPAREAELKSALRDAMDVREGKLEADDFLRKHPVPLEGQPPAEYEVTYWTNVINRVRNEISHQENIHKAFIDANEEFDAKRKELQRMMGE